MPDSRWASSTGRPSGPDYAAQFTRLAAAGADLHGEAALCASLVPAGTRVLDAGCGTGRVAIRLAELGYRCVGVDSDRSMLEVAQAASPVVTWVLHDLAELSHPERDHGLGGPFDLVVAAGNVIPLLAPGTEAVVVDGLAGRLVPGGWLVSGFGLDATHLPLAGAPFGLEDYDAWCMSSGLELQARFATWARDPYEGGGYAVSVHRRRRHADG